MYLSHPLCVTLGQIVIDRNDVNALSLQRIQIRRGCGYKRLTFTCLHLGDTPLVKNDTTDELHSVVLHVQHSSGRLTDCGKGLRQNIIQSFTVRQPLLKLLRLMLEGFIRK